MQKPFQSRGFFEGILAKAGGSYVILAIIFSQLVASIGALLGIVSERLNANYSPEATDLIRKAEYIVFPAVFLLLLSIVAILTRNVRTSLDNWRQNPELF